MCVTGSTSGFPRETRGTSSTTTFVRCPLADDDMDKEFDGLVQRMNDPEALAKIEVTEVLEKATMVEVTVPIKQYPEPEVALLQTITQYLKQGERRAIVSLNAVYEVRGGNPCLVGVIMLTDPIE